VLPWCRTPGSIALPARRDDGGGRWLHRRMAPNPVGLARQRPYG
jgi:hypothetical protein